MPDTYGADGATALCCLVAVLLGALVVVLMVRRRKPMPAAPPATPTPPAPAEVPPGSHEPWAAVPTADLQRQADSRLIEADNAVRTGEEELGFAAAQYGPEATAAYATGLTSARQEVAEAFRLRQQIDDAYPADEPVQRKLLIEIVDRCARARELLSSQADPLARLRSVESHVDQLAATLITRRDGVGGRLAYTASTLTDLESRYAASAFSAVGDNVQQATARVNFASRELDKAPRTAAAVRRAEQALGQADVLLGAVDRLGIDLETADGRLRTLLAEVQAQVAAGKAAQANAAGPMSVAAAVARAEQVAIDVRIEMAGTHPDPIGALARIEAVGVDLDKALGDGADRTDRARAMLDHALFTARTAVDSAALFITTRRGGIGSAARTRLMEAQRHLDEAVHSSDPIRALTAAQRATGLAEQALDTARSDLEQHG